MDQKAEHLAIHVLIEKDLYLLVTVMRLVRVDV